MKRILSILIILCLFLLSSCGDLQPGNINDADLDKLLQNYDLPTLSMDRFELETDGHGFPLELLNDLKKAVYTGDSDLYIERMNDKSLMISLDDFIFDPDENEDMENGLRSYRQNSGDCYYYKCDINGDGSNEIIIVENQHYGASWSNCAHLLTKSGDEYIYAGYDYLGYYRCFAIFKYEDRFYLVANYDDYQTGITKAVGLFDLSSEDSSGFMWLIGKNSIYIRKTSNGYDYNPLYINEATSSTDSAQSYLDSISVDLIYSDRTHNTFYGDEVERPELLETNRKNDPENELKIWNIYSVDIDNDRQEEYFDRKILYHGGSDMTESEVRWLDLDSRTIIPAPFDVWKPAGYYLTQMWFKVIDGKTVIFSLYHQNSDDVYLLDARSLENGKTIRLFDYVVTLVPKAELADYWDYDSDTNYIKTEYNDPNAEKAFPEDIVEIMDDFAAQTQGSIASVDHKDENIPNDLIIMMEKALFKGNIYSLNLGSASFETDIEAFYDKYGQQQRDAEDGDFILFESKSRFAEYVRHIYKYHLDGGTYYLLVVDSGGSGRSVFIYLYKETEDGLDSCDFLESLDFNARVIKYKNKLYLIDRSYNYYSKFTDTVSIYKLVPDKIGDYVTITLLPEKYHWKNIFSSGQRYGQAITDYIDGIKDDLMAKSPINDDIEIYVGDETASFDKDRLQRLKSVGGSNQYYEHDPRDYYEIDYNNDGEVEYINKYYWFPSNYTTLFLINKTFMFTDERIVTTNSAFDYKGATLVQLWFKKIDGKIFTFRLILLDGYNYFLNVSLIENTDITQVQSYIIASKRAFSVLSGTRASEER